MSESNICGAILFILIAVMIVTAIASFGFWMAIVAMAAGVAAFFALNFLFDYLNL